MITFEKFLFGIMQFKNPEILYLLFLLIIPVIIHLLQLQKFKKVAFTNVKLLKEIKQHSRKSSRLKKLLLLLTRLLLLASLIIAFAQPFLNRKDNTLNKETYIFLDNSFSMQAKGENGELLQRAKNDLFDQLTNNSNEITIITNNHIYQNIQNKNEILSIAHYPIQKDLKTVLLQIDNLRNNKIKQPADIILISDFQKKISDINQILLDSLSDYYFVQTLPVQKENISVDSVWINNKDHENMVINTLVKSHKMSIENVSISLFVNNELFGKSTISLDEDESKIVEFSIPNANDFYGRITLNDHKLGFDNTLYFNTIKKVKIPVLAIGDDNRFLSKIYTKDEFEFITTKLSNFDYSLLQKQRLIILNELSTFPNALIQSLKNHQGNLVIIPAVDGDLPSYNQLLSSLQIGNLDKQVSSKKYVNKINYNHPFFKNVFEKKTDNFQYPLVNKYYLSHFFIKSSLLKLSDDHDFLSEISKNDHKIYWFSSALNTNNSNFINSPLVVPVFYNFSPQISTYKNLYYTIGDKNKIQFKSDSKSDVVFHLKNKAIDFIPLQSKTLDFVNIQTEEKPLKAGIYSITNKMENLRKVSFNYNRNESDLSYYQLDKYKKNVYNVHYHNSVENVIEQINDQNKNRNLWQLFIIFALIFLGIEFLIQKLFKN